MVKYSHFHNPFGNYPYASKNDVWVIKELENLQITQVPFFSSDYLLWGRTTWRENKKWWNIFLYCLNKSYKSLGEKVSAPGLSNFELSVGIENLISFISCCLEYWLCMCLGKGFETKPISVPLPS